MDKRSKHLRNAALSRMHLIAECQEALLHIEIEYEELTGQPLLAPNRKELAPIEASD